jgi:hypothetical protein
MVDETKEEVRWKRDMIPVHGMEATSDNTFTRSFVMESTKKKT